MLTMRISALKALFPLWIILFLMTGCSGRESTGEEDMSFISVSDENAVIASWKDTGTELQAGSIVMGGTLYFMDAKWDEDRQRITNVSIYRNKEGANEAEKITDLGDAEPIIYFVDEMEAVYCLYAGQIGEISDYFFRKISVDGEVIYDNLIQSRGVEAAVSRLGDISIGVADREGNVCLCNVFGDFYLFDAMGQLIFTGDMWNEDPDDKSGSRTRSGLVNAGEEGIFIYLIEDRKVSLRKVNMLDGKLEEVREIQIDDGSSASLEIFNGYDMGVLISDSEALWNYNVSEQILKKLLGWGDSTVNLKNYMIDAIGVLQDESMYILVHRSPEDRALVYIDYQQGTDLQEKQTVTLAMIESNQITNSELEELAGAFNRIDTEYEVKFIHYASAFELYTVLLKGEGPDIFDFGIGGVDINVLASNGVLENLSPYFMNSDLVQEDDLLPAIRNAGIINGDFVCVLPTFSVNGLLVEKGTTDKGGWTSEEYIVLGEKYPDAAMSDHGNPLYYLTGVLRVAILADMESYVNWDKKECYLDSDRFVSLLNRIKDLNVPKTSAAADLLSADAGVLLSDLLMEQFRKREILTYPIGGGSIDAFHHSKSEGGYGGDFAEVAGYPNQSGKPYYLLECTTPLGMNTASKNKEGAWAFLEYLLAEQYQSQLVGFPVRQDSFDRHMALEERYNGYLIIDLSEEERDFIRYMVDNAYWPDASYTKEFMYIINEETEAVWVGDKPAEEGAKIIQNRIALFLSEQSR